MFYVTDVLWNMLWWNVYMTKFQSLWYHIFTIYKHDYDVFKAQRFYFHDACHLINQVITKDKIVSYRPFSLCRPKGIKGTV